MPIFMDRHDVSEEVTAEIVADLHQKDLQIQHLFDCIGLTYWFDDARKTAFCLVQAPDADAIQRMHNHAHGTVAHRIIEVDASVVESFLGRIEDPEKSQKPELNIINDPAFRIIMVAQLKQFPLAQPGSKKNTPGFGNFMVPSELLNTFKGRLVKQNSEYLLASFQSVTDAILYAIEMEKKSGNGLSDHKNTFTPLKIGLCAGIPVSEKGGIFEDTIQTAQRLCYFTKSSIAITSQVKDLYESENLNVPIDRKKILALSEKEEEFLQLFMDYIEKEWNKPTLNADNFSKSVGYSKSQLYRKSVLLTGTSPNNFLKTFRLKKALELIRQNKDNVSGIAYESGFSTPAYFSNCFRKAFGILPSVYAKMLRQSS